MISVAVKTRPTGSRQFAVKQVRGPFIHPAPHPGHCADEEDLRTLLKKMDGPTAADLFCGAGGMSLGLRDAGFNVVMGVDHDRESIETHRSLFPGLSTQWDLSDSDVVDRIASIIRKNRITLVAGGPPCQPFSSAGRGLIRHLVRTGKRKAKDDRSELWRSFLAVIEKSLPPAVLMENVPDMALDPDMAILRTMVGRLESHGYSVATKVLETWRYGVPQFRERLFLVALRGRTFFEWPAEAGERVTVANAIDDLPPVEGGARPEGGAEGFWPYGGPATGFQRRARETVPPEASGRVHDHITRPVREDDRAVFMQMDSKTRYTDIPAELRRYRDDIFTDKYKRLDPNDLSRTITAHIARDGYWYIHPEQPRTLTIREAARIQTFRDDIRFAGPPSSAFRQIGNAVPPLMAEHLGRAIHDALERRKRLPSGLSTNDVATTLANWFEGEAKGRSPWLRTGNRWHVLVGETLFDRVRQEHTVRAWPAIRMMETPEATIREYDSLLELAQCLGRQEAASAILRFATWLVENPGALGKTSGLAEIPDLNPTTAALAIHSAPGGDGDPILVSSGMLRVVTRFNGHAEVGRNRLTDGRIAAARVIGSGVEAHMAYLGLAELGRSLCRPRDPLCHECPLRKACSAGDANIRRQPSLF